MPTLLLTELRKLAEIQQYPDLCACCEEALSSGDDPAVLALLAFAQAQLGASRDAQATLARVDARRPELDVDALVDLSAALIALQRRADAESVLRKVLCQQPDHALALSRLGYCHWQSGDYEEAQRLYRRALASHGGHLAVRLLLIQLTLQRATTAELLQQDIDDALGLLQAKQDDLPSAVYRYYHQQLTGLQLSCWLKSNQSVRAEDWLQSRQAELDEEELLHWVIHCSLVLAEADQHDQSERLLRHWLAIFPNNSVLLQQLAELAQVQGRFLQAIKLLRRALKSEPDKVGLWAKLSNACLNRIDHQARHAAEKAVDLAEVLREDGEHSSAQIRLQRAHAYCALAQVESQEQNHDLAERLFRDIIGEFPSFVPALQGLGNLQMQRGDIDEAVSLFERVRAIDPVKGASALINARQFPEDETTLRRLEQAANLPSLEGGVRSSVLFQLASAWEKRGDYDKAFALAKQANEASRRFLQYDACLHRNHCARVRMAFGRELYEHRRDCGVDSTLPVFVVGMPRSGTTLVEQIVAGHSRIFGAGELGVIPQVIAGLNRWERHVGSGRAYPDCIDDLSPDVTEGIANTVLQELGEYDPQAKHIVDKLPHNFENIGLIKFLFPKAKIISVRRDPRDIGVSNYFTDYLAKHSGMGFAYDLTAIGEQLADHNLLMHHWSQVFPGEILEVKYEEVIEDLEGSTRRMLDYIGVEWEPQVLDFDTLERPVKTASVWQVRQPIYKTSKAKWRRYEGYLQALIRGTNTRIEADPVTDMVTLVEPGLLQDGFARYRGGDLDGAEYVLKKLLCSLPQHGAANFLVGLIYIRKGYAGDGIALMEKAVRQCPWKREWRRDLIRACERTGDTSRAEALRQAQTALEAEQAVVENEHDPDALIVFPGDV